MASKPKSTLQAALGALLRDISNRGEYPDAEFRVATSHKVDPGELRAAYDDHCRESSGPNGRKPISQAQLMQRAHQHSITTAEQAQSQRQGDLDLALLKQAGIDVDGDIQNSQPVRVEFSHFAHNTTLGTNDPVYRTFDQADRFIGHYFAAAFSRLAT